ncbi:DUF3040 domain-containing protein [Saccharothrix coeruleofusca]|uniref:DUF3040 family protein n=1 Tax=Saccharothrix coeruleofusca TaxID=33919 RepID=A0A918AT05_9PSEU|nr:DUF3040 domain-containing protein [Saccharothrix coeruleofusca]GGP79560.1 hypothetical protein GCM10010185_61830 [Saccharothrix coeruleofusca]
MLSEREQEALHEIQRGLIDDDPEFERSFRALDAAGPAPRTGHRSLGAAIITIAALLAFLLLLTGEPSGALAFGVIAGAVWVAQRFPAAPARREHPE